MGSLLGGGPRLGSGILRLDVFKARWRSDHHLVAGQDHKRTLRPSLERPRSPHSQQVDVALGLVDGVHHVAVNLPVQEQVSHVVVRLVRQQLVPLDTPRNAQSSIVLLRVLLGLQKILGLLLLLLLQILLLLLLLLLLIFQKL